MFIETYHTRVAHQVFISYASADKAVADRVCGALESAGVSCWIAPRDIVSGADYPSAIVDAVDAARVLVLILTEEAAASPHVVSEVSHAFNGRKRIIPFRISTAPLSGDLEYFLSITQWLDAPDGPTDRNLQRLTQATLDAVAGKSSPRPRARQRRIAWMAALAAGLALAVALFVYSKSSKAPVVDPMPTSTPTPVTMPVAKTWPNPTDGQSYVWIPPGEFTMGCSPGDSECKDDEKPTHQVAIPKGFWLAETEVTIAAYRRYASTHGLPSPAGDAALPVVDVTWLDAKKYCKAIGGRLPSEAEWEYAARAGSSQAQYGVLSQIAWYAGNSGSAPHPVRMKKANAFGLYDTLGNVGEWVLDRYYNKYDPDSPATGAGVVEPLAGNAIAVARGGYWENDALSIRVSRRSQREPDQADGAVGIRCASDHQ